MNGTDEQIWTPALEDAAVLLLRVSAEGKVLAANRGAAKVAGFQPDELLGQSLQGLLKDGADRSRWRQLLDGTLREAPGTLVTPFGERRFEWTCLSREGSTLVLGLDTSGWDSDQRFRHLAEHLDQIFYLFDLEEHRVLYVSPAYESIWGFAAEGLCRDWTRFMRPVHPDDRAAVEAGNRALLQGQTDSFELEYRVRGPDGGWRWLRDRGFAIRAPGNAVPDRMAGIVEDITQARETLEQLRFTQFAVDQASHTVFLIEAETGRIVYANLAAEALTGFTRAELGRMSIPDLDARCEEEDWQQHRGSFEAAPHQRFVTSLTRKDGSSVPVEVTAHAVRRAGREYLCGFVDDISVRLASESIARRYTSLVESTGDAVIACDPEGVILTWNPAAQQIFGYPAEEMLGRPLAWLVPPDLQAEHRDMLARAASGETLRNVETLRLSQGKGLRVSLTVSPIRDESGGCAGCSWIARDITEQKRLEALCSQAQKLEAVGRLAAGVAHDFNNLLTVITGYADCALWNPESAEEVGEALGEIRAAGERAAALTRRLLAFARKQPTAPAVIELDQVILDLSRMLSRLLGTDIELELSLAAGSTIRADAGQLEQILLNLASNSREAMPTGGTLSVRTEECTRGGQPHVLLEVGDTGVGMDEETLAHIFEPFYTTKGSGGTGLGLATVYGVVQQSGGAIEVESLPGQGTVFRIFFPAVPHGPCCAPPATREPARGAERILVVEDEPAVRQLMVSVLQNAGYDVVPAQDGEEALRLAERERFPLLVTDMVMPKMSGRELAEALRGQDKVARVLYMSGYTEDEMVRYGLTAGNESFLQKPFAPALLAQRVRELLDRS